jgi:plasmid stability protein
MARITLELPDDIRARLEARAAEAGFKSVEEHVAALIRADLDADTREDQDYGAPEDLKIRSAEDLDAKLIQGMNSPAREMTEADWDEMERRLIERHSGGGQSR